MPSRNRLADDRPMSSDLVRKYIVALGSAVAVLALGIPAAQAGTGGEQPPAGVVMATPPTNLPHLPASTSQTEQIRQLVQCGGTMYAVGSFTAIRKGSTTYTRSNVFSFKATAPYTVTSWAPDVVGTYGTTQNPSDTLNTIAFVGGDCSHAYIGGHFSSVNGTAVKNMPRSTRPPATSSQGSSPMPPAQCRRWSAPAIIC